MEFKRFDIGEELPAGYRLTTVDEVVQHGYDRIRSGTQTDIQDSDGRYFDYNALLEPYFEKTRLQNGFVENSRSLAWKEFAGLGIVEKIAVRGIPSDAQSPELSEYDRVVELLYACASDDVEEAQKLIATFPQITCKTSKGAPCRGTALHLCAWEDKLKCLELILKSDKQLCAARAQAELDGEIALLLAALRGFKEAVKQLLNFDDSQINSQTRDFRSTPLMMAVTQSRSPDVCKELLKVEKIRIDYQDWNGNTALHYAVDPSIMQLLLEHCGCEIDLSDEASVLNSRQKNCQFNHIRASRRNFVNLKNSRQETPLHRALADKKIPVKVPLMLISAGADIQMRDRNGENALHRACSLVSRTEIVRMLQKCFPDSRDEWSAYAGKQDIAGETALHTAAYSGHLDAVSVLLDDPENTTAKELVHQRDYDGRTTLHCAAEFDADPNVQLKIVEKLVQAAGGDEEQQLLLWATAENNVGTADTLESCQPKVREYLKIRMARWPTSKTKGLDNITYLLGVALKLNRHDMTVELINRGADIEHESLEMHKKRLRKLLQKHRGRTSDQPSHEDLLERADITESIAALLLNQNTGSPVTIGILGGSGMGKSSLMLQVQYVLLLRAAREGAKRLKLYDVNLCDRLLRREPALVKDVLGLLEQADGDKIDDEFFLSKHREEYLSILKHLALANREKLVPAVLVVSYNAWQYESKDEAWAGLAVQITKEMEDCMTTAQWLRMCWIYSFRSKPHQIFVQLILPVILTVLLGGWIGWAAWKLLSIPKNPALDNFKYGSLPVSVIVVFWVVLTTIISKVQPVSQQLLEYTRLPSQGEKLGYQHQVIHDINFLKKEICKEPSWFWKAIACFCKMATALLGSVGRTEYLMQTPSEDHLRIIVFIDNLDRRKEQLLTPLNLILAACDINAVVTIDKAMVEDAMQREINSNEDSASTSDLVEKFQRQLIQIPIVLPDPGVRELRRRFLKEQLGATTKDMNQKKSESDRATQPQTGLPVKRSESDAATQPQTVLPVKRRESDRATDQPQTVLSYGHTVICCNQVGSHQKGGSAMPEMEKDFRRFDSNYSTVEIEVFQYLAKHAFGDHRSPRKWKSLLNYHRLVRSIITHPSRRSTMKGWKRQLIVWVFMCWQWRDQMDDIIQSWSSLVQTPPDLERVLNNRCDVPARLLARSSCSAQLLLEKLRTNSNLFEQQLTYQKKSKEEKAVSERKEFWDGVDELYPSLKDIVETRKKERFGNDGSASGTLHTENERQSGVASQAGEQIKEIVETQAKRMVETRDDKKRPKEEWERMFKTLVGGKYDVTMQGIQAFQDFRFECKAGHLDLPYTIDQE